MRDRAAGATMAGCVLIAANGVSILLNVFLPPCAVWRWNTLARRGQSKKSEFWAELPDNSAERSSVRSLGDPKAL